MELAIAIATLLNTVAPGVAQIIMLVKQSNGTIAIMPMLDAADSKFESNIKSAQEWLKNNPTK